MEAFPFMQQRNCEHFVMTSQFCVMAIISNSTSQPFGLSSSWPSNSGTRPKVTKLLSGLANPTLPRLSGKVFGPSLRTSSPPRFSKGRIAFASLPICEATKTWLPIGSRLSGGTLELIVAGGTGMVLVTGTEGPLEATLFTMEDTSLGAAELEEDNTDMSTGGTVAGTTGTGGMALGTAWTMALAAALVVLGKGGILEVAGKARTVFLGGIEMNEISKMKIKAKN